MMMNNKAGYNYGYTFQHPQYMQYIAQQQQYQHHQQQLIAHHHQQQIQQQHIQQQQQHMMRHPGMDVYIKSYHHQNMPYMHNNIELQNIPNIKYDYNIPPIYKQVPMELVEQIHHHNYANSRRIQINTNDINNMLQQNANLLLQLNKTQNLHDPQFIKFV